MNEPMGFVGSCNPARLRLIALEILSTAFVWPITLSCNLCSNLSNLLASFSTRLSTGIPVLSATIFATCSG